MISIIRTYIRRIFHRFDFGPPKQAIPGRWNIDYSTIDRKMDMGNYDNCFTSMHQR